ncbi:azurin [Flavicella sp.]|uniref:azurin n=1 Tax=Flavicella sp. TaxID=2957742 RepID=UPI003016E30B
MKKIILSIVVLSMILSSCGNEKKKTKTPEKDKIEQKETVYQKEKSTTDVEKVTLNLGSNDQMQFDKSELKVKEGQEVTLILTHTGTMLKTVMGHNFVLLKKGTVVSDFAMEAMKASDNEYIPEGDVTIAYTKLIGGGESATIKFIAPSKGVYDYICSFPGHYGIMKGKFIVE